MVSVFFCFFFLLRSENSLAPPTFILCASAWICVCAWGGLMNSEMQMVVKQWFLQLIGCNGWYSELLHNWWGCLVDVPLLLWCGGGGSAWMYVSYAGASGWGYALGRSLFLLFVRELLSILINGSSVRRLHNVWTRVAGESGVRFPYQIERKQRRNLIVCRRRMG